jgi:hypothetical protein
MAIVRSLIILAVVLHVSWAMAAVDGLYNQVGVLKGQVVVVNNPELGRTPASGQYFLLQRLGCRRCVIGVRADIDGRYTVFVGVGKYRVVCTDPEDGKDLISKRQVREVTVRQRPNDTEFNIELELPQRK